MKIFLTHIFPIIAITYVIVYSSLLRPLRDRLPQPGSTDGNPFLIFISNLVDCSICTAFWVGIFVSLINAIPVNWNETLRTISCIFQWGCAGISIFFVLEIFKREE